MIVPAEFRDAPIALPICCSESGTKTPPYLLSPESSHNPPSWHIPLENAKTGPNPTDLAILLYE